MSRVKHEGQWIDVEELILVLRAEVERLKERCNRAEAAMENEAIVTRELRAEVERLRDLLASQDLPYDMARENGNLRGENERLRNGYGLAITACADAQQENERLRGILQAFIDDPAMNVSRDVRERVQRTLNGEDKI